MWISDDDIRTRMRARREAMGLTQGQFADKVGLQKEQYRRLEVGWSKLTRALWQRIAQGLGLDERGETDEIPALDLKRVDVGSVLWWVRCSRETGLRYPFPVKATITGLDDEVAVIAGGGAFMVGSSDLFHTQYDAHRECVRRNVGGA